MQYSTPILLATLLSITATYAQQSADGLLVPFTSSLPACASQCGPLYDVEGGCIPPVIASADQSCFCGNALLNAFRNQGTTGVSSVCGAASCTVASDLEAVKNWYIGFCGSSTGGGGTATTRNGAAATNTGSISGGSSDTSSDDGGGGSWIQTHTKWLIMAVVLVVGLILLWVGAWFFRRRYLRKKEKEIEMSPPVAWGPHQMQTATGGYAYGDGVLDGRAGGAAAGAGAAGGHHKEFAARDSTAEGKRLTKGKMSWFKAS